jgi:YD repeat-containing protein
MPMKTIKYTASCFAAMAALLVLAGRLSGGIITYTHDLAGRLTGVAYANGRSQSFAYDNAGNLLQNQTIVPAGGNDTDGDGLDDAWEQSYFGTLNRDGSGDFDGDGFIDRNEFLAGTDPTNAASLLRLGLPQLAGNSTTIQWQSVSGKTYRVQYKDTLSTASWNNISGDITAGGNVASKVDSTPPTQGHRYYRVVLVP